MMNETIKSTGQAGISISGNLDTENLIACNGINIVISMEDAELIPELLKHLNFIGEPDIEVVELLENEKLFNIRGMINAINARKRKDTIKKKAIRRKTINS